MSDQTNGNSYSPGIELTWLIVLLDTHVVRLSAPIVVERHVVAWLVVTTLGGNELTLCENEVITFEEVVEPNNVRVALGLQAIVEMR